MSYDITLVNVERETAGEEYKASVKYRFAISSGVTNAFGDVLMTDGAIDAIEQRGKDPETAARIALERLLKDGRNPFESMIFIKIPFGHAVHFARFGNYESLPILTD